MKIQTTILLSLITVFLSGCSGPVNQSNQPNSNNKAQASPSAPDIYANHANNSTAPARPAANVPSAPPGPANNVNSTDPAPDQPSAPTPRNDERSSSEGTSRNPTARPAPVGGRPSRFPARDAATTRASEANSVYSRSVTTNANINRPRPDDASRSSEANVPRRGIEVPVNVNRTTIMEVNRPRRP